MPVRSAPPAPPLPRTHTPIGPPRQAARRYAPEGAGRAVDSAAFSTCPDAPAPAARTSRHEAIPRHTTSWRKRVSASARRFLPAHRRPFIAAIPAIVCSVRRLPLVPDLAIQPSTVFASRQRLLVRARAAGDLPRPRNDAAIRTAPQLLEHRQRIAIPRSDSDRLLGQAASSAWHWQRVCDTLPVPDLPRDFKLSRTMMRPGRSCLAPAPARRGYTAQAMRAYNPGGGALRGSRVERPPPAHSRPDRQRSSPDWRSALATPCSSPMAR